MSVVNLGTNTDTFSTVDTLTSGGTDDAIPLTTAIKNFGASKGDLITLDTTGGSILIGNAFDLGDTSLVDGASIGEGSVIGAASLVRGSLPAFCLAFGVPAEIRGWRRAPP